MTRSLRMLAMALVLPVIAVGATYWPQPYNSAGTQLPSALLWWPVVLVFFGAVASRLAGAGFLASWLVAGAPLAIVVMVRVLRDTAADPTSHNLWPLELINAGTLGWGAALLGALAAHYSLRARGS